MTTENPLISIVVAVYNRAGTLRQCLESIVNQSLSNIEVIVIDGGSTDGSVEIIREYEDKIRYWSSEPDDGIYDAWNKALLYAVGDWICFVGSDDYFRSTTVLEELCKFIKIQDSELDFIYSNVMLVTESGQDLFVNGPRWADVNRQLLRGMIVPHPAMLHHRRTFHQGGFDKSYRIAGDYEFFLREVQTDKVAFAENVTSISMRQGGISSQQGNYRRSLMEVRRAQKKYGHNVAHPLWYVDFFLSEVRNLVFHLFGEKISNQMIDFARRTLGKPEYWSRL